MHSNSRDIIRRLENEGWRLARVKGDHHQYRHPERPGLVTVPHPAKDIRIGTLRSIYRQAGWTWERHAKAEYAGMSHYIALVHGEDGNFGISFPDFPGCITVSSDFDDCPRRAAEVLAFHAAGMIEEGLDLPKPHSLSEVLQDPDWGPDARGAVSILVPLVIPLGRKVQMDIMLDASLVGLIDEAALNRGQSRSEFVADATEAKLKAG